MSPTGQYSTVHVTHPYPHSTSPRTLPHPKTTQYLGPLITQSAKIHTWRNLPHQSNKPPDIEPSTHPIPSVRPQSKKPIHDSRDQKPPSSQHATLMVSMSEHRVREVQTCPQASSITAQDGLILVLYHAFASTALRGLSKAAWMGLNLH